MPKSNRQNTKYAENDLEGKKMTSPTSSYTKTVVKANSKKVADEIALLDALLAGFNIKNDAQLAIWLGIDKSLIYATRAGKRRLGLVQRLKILDHIGFLKARSLLEAILPENLAKEVITINKKMVQHQISLRASKQTEDPNVVLLDVVKDAFSYTTDADLANFLRIEHNTVSTIRAGKSALGPKPRLRILERLTKSFDIDVLLNIIESPRNLILLVEEWVAKKTLNTNLT
jgi:hypothetical protein